MNYNCSVSFLCIFLCFFNSFTVQTTEQNEPKVQTESPNTSDVPPNEPEDDAELKKVLVDIRSNNNELVKLANVLEEKVELIQDKIYQLGIDGLKNDETLEKSVIEFENATDKRLNSVLKGMVLYNHEPLFINLQTYTRRMCEYLLKNFHDIDEKTLAIVKPKMIECSDQVNKFYTAGITQLIHFSTSELSTLVEDYEECIKKGKDKCIDNLKIPEIPPNRRIKIISDIKNSMVSLLEKLIKIEGEIKPSRPDIHKWEKRFKKRITQKIKDLEQYEKDKNE